MGSTGVPPGFVILDAGRARTWVRAGHEALADQLGPRGDPVAAEAHVAGGRAPHPVVPLPDGGRALVRRYLRGGMVRHLVRATYFSGHRALYELRATERARAANVRAPEVLAATERRQRVGGYAAWLATRLIENVASADEWLRAARVARRAAMLREAGRQIARLHEGGITHPDLNLRNLLVRDDAGDEGAPPLVWIIDFDGARLYGNAVPAVARARNLRRLARSARKLGIPLAAPDWAALREGYGASWPARLDLG